MQGEQLDALVTTAADGIAFDGLAVEPDDEGYAARFGDETHAVDSESQLRSVASDHPAYVSNWYFWHAVAPQKADRWSFLRRIEGASDQGVPERYDSLASGLSTTWGELHITATISDDGEREYLLRHEADADRDGDELDTYTDPLEARDLAKHDDDDRYRPLKTAPSLQTGWQFTDLGPGELVEAVDFFYPATIPNWQREREGEHREPSGSERGGNRPANREAGLDVSHWHETMQRQTGIYGVVQTWDRGEGHEHVEWVAEACCVDSQCLKRREWEYDADTELDVDGGDGVFPCREPCSLVIAAARRWTKLEAEETQTYEFDLTPSEKEQIEEIIDAVADGETDEIREADVYEGANRYRTRFLRAKRFDENGNLSGVPIGRDEGGEDGGH